MDILPQDLSALIFRRTKPDHEDKISLDGKMLRLLLALDGQKRAGQIAAECEFDPDTLRSTASRLIRLGLIERVQETMKCLDAAFFNGLRLNLAQFLGPMADFLIEDAVADMALDLHRFPVQRAAELISALAVEIPEDASRMRFKKAMVELIPK